MNKRKRNLENDSLKNLSQERSVGDSREHRQEHRRTHRRDQRRRQVMRNRLILAAVGLLLVVLGVFLIVSFLGDKKNKNSAPKEIMAQADVLTVPHLSFDTLVVDAEAAGSDGMTVDEFYQLLQLLYDNDYLLVSIRDLTKVKEGKDGSVTFEAASLELPEGKKPFVLSQNDVSYPLTLPAGGYASRLVVDASGRLVSEYQQAGGTTVTGAYDVVSCLEAFLEEHPDFSWQGARGILGITGANGILGYRTDGLFGKSAEEGNPYADYGPFDVASETASAQAVVGALKDAGWELACQGYSGISYASESSLVSADVAQWKQKTEPVTGSTDLLLYPQGTDIASWKDYRADDQKYAFLKEQGFDIFFSIDNRNPYWVQIRGDYFRQGRMDARTWAATAGLTGPGTGESGSTPLQNSEELPVTDFES